MTADALAEHTYLPERDDELGQIYDFLAAHKQGASQVQRYQLVGPGDNDRVEVPAEIHRVLVQVVEALRAGQAVTVAPHSTVLTTQQAADLLKVSRPTVVKLIEAGAIPCERPAHRRHLLLRDVLAYRERRRQEQYDELFSSDVHIDEDDDPQRVLAELKEARKAVAAKRRARAASL